MQDREPTYPGRVTMTPVFGQANTYDMERADQPLQQGTPLNKATLLKDATAALYGLGTGAVPDDVLSKLGRFEFGIGNEYLWAKGYEKGVFLDEPSSIYMLYHPADYYTGYDFSYSDSVKEENGKIVLNDRHGHNYSTSDFTPNGTGYSLCGKFVVREQISKNDIFFIPSDATFSVNVNSGVYDVTVTARKVLGIAPEFVGYVNSPNANAYPPAVPDGFAYTPLGQLGDKVKIETGSYVGTGTYGSANPNTLTFGFVPKVWGWIGYKNTNSNVFLPDIALVQWGEKTIQIGIATGSANDCSLTYQNSSVSWVANSIYVQANQKDYTYYYIAIG